MGCEFKIGDNVELINNEMMYAKKGSIAVVESIKDNGLIVVKWTPPNGQCNGDYHADIFRKYDGKQLLKREDNLEIVKLLDTFADKLVSARDYYSIKSGESKWYECSKNETLKDFLFLIDQVRRKDRIKILEIMAEVDKEHMEGPCDKSQWELFKDKIRNFKMEGLK